MKKVILALLVFLMTACSEGQMAFSGNDLQLDVTPKLNDDGTVSDIAIEPDLGEGVEVAEPAPEEKPAAPEEKAEIGEVCLVVKSLGVSSARVELNDEVLLSESEFKNKDFEKTIKVKFAKDKNVFKADLRGSKGDSLYLGFFECSSDEPKLIKEIKLVRSTGKPVSHQEEI